MQGILKIYPNSGQSSLNTLTCPSHKLQQTPQERRQVMCQHKTSRYQGPEEKSDELLQQAQEGTTDSSFIAVTTCSQMLGLGQSMLAN